MIFSSDTQQGPFFRLVLWESPHFCPVEVFLVPWTRRQSSGSGLAFFLIFFFEFFLSGALTFDPPHSFFQQFDTAIFFPIHVFLFPNLSKASALRCFPFLFFFFFLCFVAFHPSPLWFSPPSIPPVKPPVKLASFGFFFWDQTPSFPLPRVLLFMFGFSIGRAPPRPHPLHSE